MDTSSSTPTDRWVSNHRLSGDRDLTVVAERILTPDEMEELRLAAAMLCVRR